MKTFFVAIFSILLTFAIGTLPVAAQTTAFNYQGRLTDGGNPANGGFLMQFKLFDAVAGGSQVGSTITDVAVTATSGAFSARLDFGAAPLSGANRWIEIAVRRNAGESYVTLSPREQIASSPYAVKSVSATMADDSQKLGGVAASEYVTNATVGGSFIRNGATPQTATFNVTGNGIVGGQVGINAPINPNFHLDVQGGVRAFSNSAAHFVAQTVGGTNSWARFYMRSPNRSWFVGTSQNFNTDQLYIVDETAGQSRMVITTAGKVGIGTTNPAATLEVAAASVQERVTDTTSGNSLVLQGGAGSNMKVTGYNYGTSAAVPLYLSVDGANTILNSGGGNVGVGTASPNARLTVAGNATQDRGSGGLAKALIHVNGDATILRCYNGTTGASTGGCGFTAVRNPGSGSYVVNFGFQISDRFWATSVDGGCCNSSVSIHVDLATANALTVRISDQTTSATDRPFMIIVY